MSRVEMESGERVLQRWDFLLREHLPHVIPASWRVARYVGAYAELVNCAGCGRPLPWGETYTSLEIHDGNGLGYGVCERCYDAEERRRRAAMAGAGITRGES